MIVQNFFLAVTLCLFIQFNTITGLIDLRKKLLPSFTEGLATCVIIMLPVIAFIFQKVKTGRQSKEIADLRQQLTNKTNELALMRQAIAEDFHDETGTLLSVIQHQAQMLKLKTDQDLQPMVDHIIESTGLLYTSSKDFLWHLHNTGENPAAIFSYLGEFGQSFFSKFDIDFSVANSNIVSCPKTKLTTGNVLSLIRIFKEAMNNVVKHSEAREVQLTLTQIPGMMVLALVDNGCWKQTLGKQHQHGMQNIRERSRKNGFQFTLQTGAQCTRVEVGVYL